MNEMLSILKDKNVLITGATGGLGECIASEFAKYGCNLFLTGTSNKKLDELLPKINSEKKVYCMSANLEKVKDVENLAYAAMAALGNIDILINCAGIFVVKSLNDTKIEDFNKSFEVNVRAPFLLTQKLIHDMIQNEWGRIVNIGSSSSYNGFKNTSAYCASKHALLGLTRAIHDEYRTKNIRSFCFSPGSIQTEMGKKVKNQDFDTFIDPQEIAKHIVFSICFDGEMISNEIQLTRINI
jgi:3-oxoacyl-[acyl-carrier protein] reductase